MREANDAAYQPARRIPEQCGKFLIRRGKGKPGYRKSGCRLSSRGSDFLGVHRAKVASIYDQVPLTFP